MPDSVEELKIQLTANLEPIKNLNREIANTKNALATLSLSGKEGTKNFENFSARLTNLKTIQKELNTQLGGVSVKTKLLTVDNLAMAASYLGVGIGLQQVIEFAKDSILAFAEEEKAITRLTFALQGNKGETERLIAKSNELMGTTIYSHETINQAQGFLALQGRTEEQINKVIETAINLSSVTGDDLDSSVRKLDMTYEGSIGRLGRLDGRLKDLTKEQLENGAAVDILYDKYKGLGEEMGSTTAGKIEKAKNQWGEFKEAVGEFILLGDPLKRSIESWTEPFINDLTNIGKGLNDITQSWLGLSEQASTGINLRINISATADQLTKDVWSILYGKDLSTTKWGKAKDEGAMHGTLSTPKTGTSKVKETKNDLKEIEEILEAIYKNPAGHALLAMGAEDWNVIPQRNYASVFGGKNKLGDKGKSSMIEEAEDTGKILMDAFSQSLGIASQISQIFGGAGQEIINAFQTAFNLANSIISLIATILSVASGGLPIPGMAGGGSVSAGTMYRVNENNMEYFRPAVSGTIIPLRPSGGGGDIVVNIRGTLKGQKFLRDEMPKYNNRNVKVYVS